ncbi:MAG TPA: molybdate ABC transporter substrate-binding protein [Magnetospirillaceae bacterium]
MTGFMKRFGLLAMALGLGTGVPAIAHAEIQVFAAASTTESVNAITAAFAAKKLGSAKTSFGSSSTLAKQIENAAPAAVFISADEDWMDYLDKKKLLVAGTRADLLGNDLVMIAPKDGGSPKHIQIGPNFPLAKLLGDGRLSVGDPAHVPAGLYAKAALEKLGVWNSVKDKLAPGQDVRAALAFVERGETPYGIVYATDAIASSKVWEVGIFPDSSHPKISYPVAVVAGHDTPEARAFVDFLKGPEAAAIFAKAGFRKP